MADLVVEPQAAQSSLKVAVPGGGTEIPRSPVATLERIGTASGMQPVYIVPKAAGSRLFAAKWRFQSFRVSTGDLLQNILSFRTAGTATIARHTGGKFARKLPTIGSVTFAAADTPAHWSTEGTCESVHIYIDRDATRAFADQHFTTGVLPRIDDFFAIEDPWLKGYLQMLLCECELFARSRQPIDELFLAQTELLLIRHLLCWHSNAGRKDVQAVVAQHHVNPLRTVVMRRVSEYIDANLAGDIHLGDLAAVACMSVGHFMRAFRAACGLTPYHYVLEQRLQRACELLRRTGIPVSRIAVECGFKTLSHFSTTFHARLGVSPSKYRATVQA